MSKKLEKDIINKAIDMLVARWGRSEHIVCKRWVTQATKQEHCGESAYKSKMDLTNQL